MKFRSFSNRPAAVPCPAGKPVSKVFKRVLDTAGNSDIVYAGEEAVYESIQLAARGTLTKDLISRSLAGDDSAIPTPIESFADITDAPGSLLEAQNHLISAREVYDKLPADVKSRYGNNFGSFLSAVSDGSYMKREREIFDQAELNKKNAEAAAKAAAPISDDVLNYIKSNIGG